MDNYIKKIKTKNIHIVGFSGTEGSAVLEFLAAHGVKNITAHDFSADKNELRQNFSKTRLWIKKKAERLAEFENLLKMPAKLNLKNKYLEGIMEADLIFIPSSWYLYKSNFPMLKNAKDKGIEISGITKLYFALAKGKIISVTGTKGKGTTSRLIYEILLKSNEKRNVYLAGNDRRAGQELEKISKMEKRDILILETSNRQLMNELGESPNIGVITNISADHIDEHGSFKKYIETKKSLFKNSKKGDIAALNYDNEITRRISEELIGRGVDVYFFSRKEALERGIFLEKNKIYVNIKNKEYICDVSEIKLIGEHNVENVLAAALVAYLAGANSEKIRAAIKNFRGLPHRLEFVGEYNGVKFYDDLASTNPESTIAAIKAIASQKFPPSADPPKAEKVHSNPFGANKSQKLFLISGGDDKGMDYSNLTEEIIDKVNVLILLPGTGSEKLKCQISNVKCQIKPKAQMSSAKQINPIAKECNDFLEALDFIKKQTKAGDIVLISPACAHFQAWYIDSTGKSLKRLIVENFAQLDMNYES